MTTPLQPDSDLPGSDFPGNEIEEQHFIEAANSALNQRLVAPEVHPQSGGSAAATAIVLCTQSQQSAFIKIVGIEQYQQLAMEADGIAAIANTQAIRTPKILANGDFEEHSWLAMEALPLQPLKSSSAALLGEHLAALHSPVELDYGWHSDGYLGASEQPNDEYENWIEFFRDQRLGYQLQLAAGNGFDELLDPGYELLTSLDALFTGYQPQPSLIHGDLWPGNAAQLADGTPVIFDPAAYYGDHEAELGMCELFGGFPKEFWQAYAANKPIDGGFKTRRYIYRLYHMLNHLNLFGERYLSEVQALLRRLLAEVR